MHLFIKTPETMINFICLAVPIFILITLIVFKVVRNFKRPDGVVVYNREVLDSSVLQDIEQPSVYQCHECGELQHGNPPCEMCGSEWMKAVN